MISQYRYTILGNQEQCNYFTILYLLYINVHSVIIILFIEVVTAVLADNKYLNYLVSYHIMQM